MHNYYLKFNEYSNIASQLKMFRSIVRMKEIKKSLQEQRFVSFIKIIQRNFLSFFRFKNNFFTNSNKRN